VNAQLDHLVVVADTLERGAAWCEATLGAAPAGGGQHPLMGTHNRLLAIGGATYPRCYLEIIAIDPAAAPPGRARWFGLDDAALRAAAREQPRLVHAVARTTNIEMLRWGLINCALDPGTLLAAHRDTPAGRLSWRISVRDDGALLCDGALPTLIEWSAGSAHPCDQLPHSEVTLRSLSLRCLPARAAQVLRLAGVDTARADGPALRASFDTPRGVVVLDSWR
jgi:Glyoxalase-like domain